MIHYADALIVGAGVMDLATAKALLETDHTLRVVVLEKERTLGVRVHASGWNLGILHARFYCSPDSLKTKFFGRKFCRSRAL